MKKGAKFLVVLTMLLCSVIPAMAADDIVIYYTNDVHTYIDNYMEDENGLSYSKVAALKDATPGAILVDAGDHIQGTAYGGMDKGATIIELMNAAGYDLATMGNHEFDYGMDRNQAVVAAAEYPYVSCNFCHAENGVVGEQVLNSYIMVERGGKKIAFIGITTPETLTSTTPTYFQNDAGDYIYTIVGGEDGGEMYAAVQEAIDAAKAEGADYVIGLGHLGEDYSYFPWMSPQVIANTSGLDAFIDGHSHTMLESRVVTDRNGENVILTQTGSYLDAVGEMKISEDGSISTRLLSGDMLSHLSPDAEVRTLEDAWIDQIEEELGQVIGYAQVTFDNFDAQGNRLVRKQSTNTGDFAADALYFLFDSMGLDVDMAIMNGGGIRNRTMTGELNYFSCKEIHTFGNVACMISVTGQQVLDLLEWSVHELRADGKADAGSFMHPSGMRYTADLTVPSTVGRSEKGVWIHGPTGEYRVRNVEIWDRNSQSYQPLDLNRTYNLAGYNYTLRDLGGGFEMLRGAPNVLDYVAEDYMVLAEYIKSFPVSEETGVPTITAEHGYGELNGQGRVTVVTQKEEEPEGKNEPDKVLTYRVKSGDSLWSIARSVYGSGAKWNMIFDANRDVIEDPNLIRIGQHLRIP